MNKFIFTMVNAVCVLAFVFSLSSGRSNIMPQNYLLLQNIEALSATERFPSGTCYGTGPGFTNVSCPGGDIICCWAHTNVYGR